MKATESNLLKFLQGAKQFIIPIYQRTYSWHIKQCNQLLVDILNINNDKKRPGHFIGSVVYFEQSIHTQSEVPKLLIIDGQQRLTTIMLLIAAMEEFLENNKEVKMDTTSKKLRNYYLVNSEEENELYFKLLLTRKDKEVLKSIVKKIEFSATESPRLTDNFNFFKSKITKENIQNIYNGVQRLFIVDVALERGKDNPQLIFESLNSTGLELSQADLIRNCVLMGQEPKLQKHLYESYWYLMENNFGNRYATLFDGFMRHYLTVKTGTIPRINEVYEKYKEYTNSTDAPEDIEEVVKDIYAYSKYYVNMALGNEENKKLLVAFWDLSILRVEVAYPMLLELYHDYDTGVLDYDSFLEIIRMIESYVFRRVICGIPTNSLNKTFLRFMKEVDKENYLESVRYEFISKTHYRRFPTDVELKREMLIKDVYNYRSRNYLLRKLENEGRKEKVNVEEYTIEHIMPQNENFPVAWRNELGVDWKEIKETYLHTIGNITLTGYNSELSDRPFVEKLNMEGGFKDSPLRLNRNVANQTTWNKTSIIKRAEEIIEKTISIWQYPNLSEEVIEKFKTAKVNQTSKYKLSDHPQLQGEMLDLFNQLRKRIMNLDSSVVEEIKKLYIAFKTTTNFVDVVPQKSRLRLALNMKISEIDDPKNICKDVTELGRWGNGDVEVGISNLSELEDVMFLIHQSFEKHSEGVLQ